MTPSTAPISLSSPKSRSVQDKTLLIKPRKPSVKGLKAMRRPHRVELIVVNLGSGLERYELVTWYQDEKVPGAGQGHQENFNDFETAVAALLKQTLVMHPAHT